MWSAWSPRFGRPAGQPGWTSWRASRPTDRRRRAPHRRRTRGIGMLRAIGLDRLGVRRMVRLESLLIALIGVVIGVLLGIITASAAVQTMLRAMEGITVVVPPVQIRLCLLAAAVVGLLAGAWPAHRAARTVVLGAIRSVTATSRPGLTVPRAVRPGSPRPPPKEQLCLDKAIERRTGTGAHGNPRMINPIHVRTLSVVLETGSFSEAAGRLGYTSSAVSQHIGALERVSGLVLFERGARSVRPTSAALALGQRCYRVLGELAALEDEVRALASGSCGMLRLGSFPTAQALLVPPALARLTQEYPGADVALEEGEPSELVPLVAAGRLDAALIYAYDRVHQQLPLGVAAVELLRESLFVLIPPADPVALAERVCMADLRGRNWITSQEESAGARSLANLCASAGFAPQVAFRSNDYNVIRAMVRAGLGVALIPELAVTDELRPSVRLLDEPSCARRVYVVRRTTGTNLLVPRLEDALRRASSSYRRHCPPTRAAEA
ncbi:LysR substrate-binding domain-containing protein [Kitasatospora sp. NPDC089797]|uniref:LysR substrate-binding domain-containing protein n=1 Tax=Kitasatospora sp. NPDC089797 TaxID=3155298 RepID=UPI00342F256D